MKKSLLIFVFLIVRPVLSRCQTAEKMAHEAFVLTRMISKYHVDPRPMDKAFSANVFSGILLHADNEKLFFLQGDIAILNPYSNTLNDEIAHSKTGFLNRFIALYQRRLMVADSALDVVSKQPFDFNKPERYTIAEQTTYPATTASAKQKWYKKIRAEVLERLLDDLPEKFTSLPLFKQNHYLDSAAKVLASKICQVHKRAIARLLNAPGGLPQYVGNLYCQSIASCFDPHTEFFPPADKENFESILSAQPYRFGFSLKPGPHGGVLIENLTPGSPAFKGGRLNRDDKFLSVEWENKQPIDVSDFTMDELSEVLSESNHLKAQITVKKTNGSVVKVWLQKEQIATDDEDRVKSFILTGTHKAGYIYLPAFYEDWAGGLNGINGCANDVGKEIIKLKQDHIDGLILDLRYNGGGSVQEAAELAGIFIDAGPVAQQQDRDRKTYVLKDVNRGTIYDGPLVIMVNGYTASAAELVAGTLQDYNRAVILGSPTFGKATAQVVLPMDTTVTPQSLAGKKTLDYLKLTISRLYRVNGTTAQLTGVQPDIVLPDMLMAFGTKEALQANALHSANITPNKYYTPYPLLALKNIAAAIQLNTDTITYFKNVKKVIDYVAQQKGDKDIPLNFKDALAQKNLLQNVMNKAGLSEQASKNFTVHNNGFATEQLKADVYLNQLYDEFSHQIAKDPYIDVAYQVLGKLKSQ